MATVNIPSSHEDPNYRYKMPKVRAKIEGRGNGIKTNIMNMGDIARALKRPPEYATKFCGCELGSQSKFEGAEGKAIVNGAHTDGDLQIIIDKFVDKFVLCPNCRLPEVDLLVAKGRVRGKCNACGFQGDMDNTHKLGTYILKNPPDGGDSTLGKKGAKKSKLERRAEKAGKGATLADPDIEAESVPAAASTKTKKHKESTTANGEEKSKKHSKEVVDGEEKKKSKKSKESSADGKKEKKPSSKSTTKVSSSRAASDELAHEGSTVAGEAAEMKEILDYDSPEIDRVIDRLKVFLTSGALMAASSAASVTPASFFHEVRLLQVAQDFDATLRVYVSFVALLLWKESDIRQIKSIMPFLAAVCDRSVSGEMICEAFEEILERKAPHLLSHYSKICSELYHADLVDEDVYLSRYASSKQTADTSTPLEKARRAASVFIQWLEEAESASDNSDNEEGGSLSGEATHGLKYKQLGKAVDTKAATEDEDVDVDDL